MLSKNDPTPEGFHTIDEILEKVRDRLKGHRFPDEVEQWIQEGLRRSEIAAAATDEEHYRKLARQLHREDRREIAINELATAKVGVALSSGVLHALVRDPETGMFFRIRADDWRLMHQKSWTIQRGWLCVNAMEPCAQHSGRSVLIAYAVAEQFLNGVHAVGLPPIPKHKPDKGSRPPSKPHRPAGRSYAKADEPVIEEMHLLITAGDYASPAAAALKVVKRAFGSGTEDSKVHRLVTRYKKQYGK